MSDQWKSIQDLFEKALEVPVEDRPAFVKQQAADNSELLKEVMSLLDAYSEDSEFLGGNAFAMIVPTVAEEGELFGPYRIVEKIGAGGMGTVFLAERADGSFEQQVALKIVKKGMDSEAVLERFRLERQVLARLEHPNIARLLDGGISNDSRPFFVMEYVVGIPITDYCDQNRLSVDDRLRLFSFVCRAVHHAHKNLIVHRDLKPSNILVTPEGDVKLLDFGIAKVLSEGEDFSLTRTGQHILTPAYASPEQISSEAITTSSDVYSLGVILYELLAGRRPFELKRSRKELEQLVISQDPDRPSTAIFHTVPPTDLDTEPVTPQTVSEYRGTRVEKLKRKLSGDLDKICLMALRKEAERRYPSAQDLAEDIHRHLEGLTVYAQPDSLSYRSQKFLSRNKFGVAAAALVFCAFLAMVAFYTQRLAKERDFALAEQAKTEEVVDFVTGLFEYADPEQAKGRDVTVREILDLGALEVHNELQSQPEIQSSLQRVLGEVYYGIGDLDTADSLLQRALLHETSGELPALDIATAQLALGIIYQDRGDSGRADSLYSLALATRKRILPYNSPDIAEVLNLIGHLNEIGGDYASAESLYSEVIRINQTVYGSAPSTALAESFESIASLFRLMDRDDEAESYYLQALEMQTELYDGDHLEIAETQKGLASVYRDTDRFQQAESLYIKVLATRRQMLGPTHTKVSNTLNSYASLLSKMDRIDEAIEANREMIRIHRINFAGPHRSLAAAYSNLAIMLRDNGDLDGSNEYFGLSIAMQDSSDIPKDHPDRAYPWNGLAINYSRVGKYREASTILRDVLELRRKALTSDHRYTMDTASDLALNLVRLKEYSEAEELLLEAYSYFLNKRGQDDYRTQRTARRLIQLYTETGDSTEAQRFEDILVEDSNS